MTLTFKTPPSYLIVITGPTAVGKTDLCIQLAKSLSAEIVSADSRQFFKNMHIGTARPLEEEWQGVPHHLMGHIDVQEEYNAGKFEQEALQLLEQLFKKNQFAILSGGSGLYIDALCNGIDDIPKSEEIRSKWQSIYEKQGIELIQNHLADIDPIYYEQVDQKNPVRLIRAIEATEVTGIPYSQLRKKKKIQRPFEIIKIALELDRDVLYQRINKRVDLMLQQGLLDEVKSLSAHQNLNALQTVGYRELFPYLNQECSLKDAVDLIKRNTRRYAKRQLTWLRKEDSIHWFSPSDLQDIQALIKKLTSSK